MNYVAMSGAVCAASAAAIAFAVRAPSSSLLGPSAWHGDRRRRALAVTFDDGPSEATPRILDLLDRHGARGTFFQIGMNVERLPQVARDVLAAGHEIGNHSYSHTRMYLRRPDFILRDFGRAQRAIQTHTGFGPGLMRAPFGARWFGFRAMQRQLGLVGVMWTVIGYDWRLPGDAVALRILRSTANGAIICLHDGRGVSPRPDVSATVAALERLLPVFADQGFEMETVSQLICPTN